MIVVRDTFTAKPGQASKLAKLFKRAMGSETNVRVLTDYVGPYNTVVMEMTFDDLAGWEAEMKRYMSGELKMDPEIEAEFKNYTELWQTGRREIYRVVE